MGTKWVWRFSVKEGRPTNTFLGERYRRIARHRGKKKAAVAIGRSILVSVWHLLRDDAAKFNDLGPGYCDSPINPDLRSATTSARSKPSATR
jgi:transposase